MKRKIYLTIVGLVCAIVGAWTVSLIFPINKSAENKNETDFSSYLQPDYSKITNQPFDTNAIKPPKLSDSEYIRLITCEICGYKAVCPDSTYCYNCISEIFDLSIYDKSERLDWLKNQQLIWFTPTDISEKINFFEPQIENGFKKDSLWKPAITQKEIIDYHNSK